MYVAMWYQLNHAGIARETANCLRVAWTGKQDPSTATPNAIVLVQHFSPSRRNRRSFNSITAARKFFG